MSKQNSHIVAGSVLVFIALCAILGACVALSEQAHANAERIEVVATARDWQRLNACAQYALTPTRTRVSEIEAESTKCSAWGKAVAKIEQLYPYKFGTPVKKNGSEAQNERIAYAWKISKWTDSTAFLNMIAGENGKFEEGRRSNVVTKLGREKSWGFCQLNSYYKPRYFKKENDGTVRIFTDWKYQMRVCFKEFQSAPHHFYGGLKNNMWMYDWELSDVSMQVELYYTFQRIGLPHRHKAEVMPEFDGLYAKYLKLYSSMTAVTK